MGKSIFEKGRITIKTVIMLSNEQINNLLWLEKQQQFDDFFSTGFWVTVYSSVAYMADIVVSA